MKKNNTSTKLGSCCYWRVECFLGCFLFQVLPSGFYQQYDGLNFEQQPMVMLLVPLFFEHMHTLEPLLLELVAHFYANGNADFVLCGNEKPYIKRENKHMSISPDFYWECGGHFALRFQVQSLD